MKKLNLLVSAIACNPLATEESYPGEAILGWNLIKQLSRYHKITVITRAYNREGIKWGRKKDKIENINFYYLTLPRVLFPIRRNIIGFSLYYLLWQIKAYFLARKLHNRFDFDAFHHITFNNDWMPSFIGAYFSIPFIWGPMGGGQKVPSTMKKEMSLKDRVKENVRVRGKWFWRRTPFRKMCVKKALAILVCNLDTRKKIKCSEKKIHFFPVNGILADELQIVSTPRQESMSQFRVIYAGRLDGIKGLSMGIKAFHVFSGKYPDSRFEIIGKGPEKNRLDKLVANLGLHDKVIFTPWLDRKALFQKLYESHILLFPSLRDGGGAIVVEAMACGKPIVCLDIGGPGFHIQKEWGFKIEPKNPEYVIKEMEKVLVTLYRNEKLRETLGKAAYKRALDFYQWDLLGERLKKIYERALSDMI